MTSPSGLGRYRVLLWPTLFAALAMALLLNLGFWQLRRLEEKTQLLARISSRAALPPLDLNAQPDWQKLDVVALDYAPAQVSGHYLHKDEALVFEPAAKGETGLATKGYAVLTPLETADGRILIVNRGFVPEALGAATARSGGQVSGEALVKGILRAPQRRGAFTPADEPQKNLWFTRDPLAIANNFALKNAAPLYLDADASPNPGGWPKGGNTEIKIPNNHLEYAVTWFGFAATLVGVYAFFAHSLLRRKVEKSGGA